MNQGPLIVSLLILDLLKQQILAVLAVRTEYVWHVSEEGGRHLCSENLSSLLGVHIVLKMLLLFFCLSFRKQTFFQVALVIQTLVFK